MAKRYSTPIVSDLGDMQVLTNLKAGNSINSGKADYTSQQVFDSGGGVSFGFNNTAQYGHKQPPR